MTHIEKSGVRMLKAVPRGGRGTNIPCEERHTIREWRTQVFGLSITPQNYLVLEQANRTTWFLDRPATKFGFSTGRKKSVFFVHAPKIVGFTYLYDNKLLAFIGLPNFLLFRVGAQKLHD